MLYLDFDDNVHTSFELFLLTNAANMMSSKKNNHVNCINCGGWGLEYDPDDPSDVYEGNKLRNTIPCTRCRGAKHFPLNEKNLKPYRDYFKKQYVTAEKERKKAQERTNLKNQILQKLNDGTFTAEELKYIMVNVS